MPFNIFIKPTTITVDCYTSKVMAYNMAKIEPSIKFIPQWWKNMQSSLPSVWGNHPYVHSGTLKKCSGFLDLYKSGFIIPMWCDLAIDVGPIGSNGYKYQYADLESCAEVHVKEQRGAFGNEQHYQHIKLESPWHLVSKADINWMFIDVVWNDTELLPYRVLTGVVNYKYVNGTNINMLIKREESTKQIFIPYKTPLVQIVPMTDKRVKIVHHLVDENTLNKKTTNKNLNVKFINRLQTFKSQMKCPVRHN